MSSLSVAEAIIIRLAGPMGLRIVIQPLVALLLGVRDGIKDAKGGESPFIFGLVTNRVDRKAKLTSLFKSLSKVIIISVTLEVIIQYLLLGQVHVIGLIFYVILLVVPYSLARDITNTVATKRKLKKTEGVSGKSL